MTPEEAETKLLAACREAVDAIVDDLSGRSGLGNALDECDSGVQREMRETWTQLVLSELSRLEQSRVERALAWVETWHTLLDEGAPMTQANLLSLRAILTAPVDSPPPAEAKPSERFLAILADEENRQGDGPWIGGRTPLLHALLRFFDARGRK